MLHSTHTRRALALAIASVLTLSLAACGGGGGNVRPSNPPPPVDGGGGGGGGGGGTGGGNTDPCATDPSAPGCTPPATYDAHRSHLDPINAGTAAAAGITGKGVAVGIVDSGADASNAALSGRIGWSHNYLPANLADASKGDVYGHGTTIAELIGGKAVSDVAWANGTADFPGGVAPESTLLIARVADDKTGSIQPQYLQQAYTDLVAHGARIINNSFGETDSITDVDASGYPASYHDIFKPAVDGGALMVFAAGNDSKAQVAVEAGMPYLFPDLADNWLAVVNVTLDSDGKVSGLDGTSNACGVAAAWCLAAPGQNYFVPVGGTVYKTGLANGTSASAAVVSGAAALIGQEFPWMTASNLQQTLLGTATSLGDPSVYGYGLVNVQKALGGPAKLDWNAFVADVPSGSYTFSNDLSGTGGLVKAGSGTLTLTGANTNAGGITVNGGTLVVNGSASHSVFVNSGGVLGGSGTLNVGSDQLINSGTVTTAYGALNVKGDYNALNSSAVTAVKIGTPLAITGKATLNGSVLNLVAPPSTYTVKATETVLTAGGGVVGTFGTTTYDPSLFYTGTLAYHPTDVTVSLTRSSVQSTAITLMAPDATTLRSAGNIETALKQADGWVATGEGGHEAFLASANALLSAPTVQSAAVAIDSLSGQIHASSQAQVFELAGIADRALSDRVDSVAQGQGGGVWVQATGASGAQARSGYASGDYDSSGLLLGADAQAGDNALVGLALGRNRLTSTYARNAGRGRSRDNSVSLYGRYNAGNAYVTGRAGLGWLRTEVDRQAVLGGTAQAIASSRDDRVGSAYLETGMQLQDGQASWTPFVAASYDRLSRGRIGESGAGGFGLVAAEQVYAQSAGMAGARFRYTWSWAGGQSALQGYALWQHVFAGTDLAFNAAFAGAPTATFRVDGINTRQNSAWFGLGIETRVNDRWSWSLNYDGKQAGQGNRSNVLSAGVRVQF